VTIRVKTEEYPAIRAAAISAGASVFFLDEAGVRTDYHSGTTWAPVGATPIVKGCGSRGVSREREVSARLYGHAGFS
jgi:hypothetical protein